MRNEIKIFINGMCDTRIVRKDIRAISILVDDEEIYHKLDEDDGEITLDSSADPFHFGKKSKEDYLKSTKNELGGKDA